MTLDNLLYKHLKYVPKALAKDLMAWKEQEFELNQDKTILKLRERVSKVFGVPLHQKNNTEVYLAARMCFWDIASFLYPNLSTQQLVNYTDLKSHCTVLNARKRKAGLYHKHPNFKRCYIKVAKRYKFEPKWEW